MNFDSPRKFTKSILFTFLILLLHNQSFCQSDSIYYWQKEITNCSSLTKSKDLTQNIRSYLIRTNKKYLFEDATILLLASSNSEYSKELFHDLFYLVESISKSKKLETEFSVFAIRLESSDKYLSTVAKYQLYYYYTLFYYHLKDFYYANKYCDLFLKYGQHVFSGDYQSNFILNAMTISALIDIEKNDLNSAFQKLKSTLDSSIAKKNNAWIGITKGNIGDIFYRQGKFEDAIVYLNEDIKTSLANNENQSALNSYLEIKDIYSKQFKSDKAEIYLDSAYSLLKTIIDPNPLAEEEYITECIEVYTSLANRFYLKKDFTNASKFFAKAAELQNTKVKNEKESQIKNIVQKIKVEENLNQLNELHEEIEHKKSISFYFQGIIIAIIAVLIIYIVFFRRLKLANKNLIEKNDIIHKQNLDLERINNDKVKLFSIISHDLRGPSKNLQLIFKAVTDNKLPFSSLESQIPNILKNTTNLVDTLESLLNWSASQLRGIKANKILLDINEAVENNIHLFEDQAHKKNITLQNNCHSIMVSFDKNHLEMILRNLTSNAIKFSKQISRIQFNLRETSDYLEICVVDQGIGLTEIQIQNILNKNGVKSTVGTIGEKGIGLGLILTKEIIEINDGSFYVKSDLNHGTTISFTIPKAI